MRNLKNRIARLAKETAWASFMALAATALVAGGGGAAAQTQETETVSARTGDLSDDCNGLQFNESSPAGTLELSAECRTSDTTLSRTERTFRIDDRITNNAGTLTWNTTYSSLDTTCGTLEFPFNRAANGYLIRSTCTTDGSVFGPNSTSTNTSSLTLDDYLEVNDAGEIVAK